MGKDTSQIRPGGFWVRTAALSVDVLVVWLAVRSVIALLNLFNIYIPLELTLCSSFIVYSILLVGSKNQTLGKMLMKVRVTHLNGDPIGYRESLLRSSVLILLAGFRIYIAVGPDIFYGDTIKWIKPGNPGSVLVRNGIILRNIYQSII